MRSSPPRARRGGGGGRGGARRRRRRGRVGGLVMALLSEADHALVTAAVAAAERSSDGEIVTVVAGRSDGYHDVAAHYAVLGMLIVPAKIALLPQGWIDWAAGLTLGWNAEFSRGALMVALFAMLALAFLLVRLLRSEE